MNVVLLGLSNGVKLVSDAELDRVEAEGVVGLEVKGVGADVRVGIEHHLSDGLERR